VVVCDGFTGNVVLKTTEGLIETVERLLGNELRGTFTSEQGSVLSRPRVPPAAPARGLLRVRRRAAARRGGHRHRGARTILGQGDPQRHRHGARLASSDVVAQVTHGVAVAGGP
jgi:fatty acid/phospholipid biosynthesis enzyme